MSLDNACFKVLGPGRHSFHGGHGTWDENEWRTVEGQLRPCRNGIHYCRAGQLVQWLGPSIWLFEDGAPEETIDAGNKLVTRKGRITERVETWNDRTARLFAADCAEAVLGCISESRRSPFAAAIEAARAFARGEIGDRERAAAWAAAGAADRAAAWAADRAAQTTLLFEYLTGNKT